MKMTCKLFKEKISQFKNMYSRKQGQPVANSNKCSKCKGYGHNKRSCTAQASSSNQVSKAPPQVANETPQVPQNLAIIS